MSTATIVVFIYMGNVMNLSSVYTINLIFNYVKDPMRMLPLFIAQIMEFRLSMRRIEEFLLCDEINPSLNNLENL